jgi:hypothetical protein
LLGYLFFAVAVVYYTSKSNVSMIKYQKIVLDLKEYSHVVEIMYGLMKNIYDID